MYGWSKILAMESTADGGATVDVRGAGVGEGMAGALTFRPALAGLAHSSHRGLPRGPAHTSSTSTR